MSTRHAEIARETIEAWARGDVDRALSFTAPKIVAVRAEPLPDWQTYHGREGVVRMYDDWTSSFEEFEMWVADVREVGERVVAQVSQRGTGKLSGVPVESDFWFVYTFDGDTIARFEAFATQADAMAAATTTDDAPDRPGGGR